MADPASNGGTKQLCREFQDACSSAQLPQIEIYLARVDESVRAELLTKLLALEWKHRQGQGEEIDAQKEAARFPEYDTIVRQAAEAFRHPSAPERFAADRNLLFGILALQLDLVSQADLVQAMQTWVADKRRELGDILVDNGLLEESAKATIQHLVDLRVEKYRGNVELSLVATGVPPDVAESLRELDDRALSVSLSALDSLVSETLVLHPESRARGRFAIVRLHDKGGLGEVFLAHDNELNRRVALKQIRKPAQDDEGSRARFLLEAEITGGLEHPGIVPVYALGYYEENRPYYAMRFIHGDSLRVRIKEFHKTDRRSSESALEFRKLLGHFVDVCHAVEYAHGRGVIHRDLKPRNVMLGKYGETIVVDWGLAKPVGRGSEEKNLADETTLRPRTPTGSSSETAPGQLIGTPAYMSPEQARGKSDQVGHASDVYSLGAILYCILTGEPPFTGESAQVIPAVIAGRFRHPRDVDPRVAAALNAICLKAMSTAPDERYTSARAVADDVDRWLADEPISAFREPPHERLRRFARRHRAATAGLAAAVLVALVSLGIGLSVVTGKNTELKIANSNLTTANTQVKLARSRAEELIQDYFTEVSESSELLRDTPGTQELRRRLLEKARDYWQEQTTEEGAPKDKIELALANLRLGQVLVVIDENDDAIERFSTARDIYHELFEQHGSQELQIGFAKALGNLGFAYKRIGDLKAEPVLREALSVFDELDSSHSRSQQLKSFGENCRFDLALILIAKEQFDEAERLLQICEADARSLIEDSGTRENVHTLGHILLAFGMIASRRDDVATQMSWPQKAIDLLQPLVESPEHTAKDLGALADAHHNLAVDAAEQHDHLLSEKHYLRSIELCRQLRDENPLVGRYRRLLADAIQHLSENYWKASRYKEATDTARQAIEIQTRLVEDFPDNLVYLASLGFAYDRLAQSVRDTDQLDMAHEYFEKAIVIRKQLVSQIPDEPRHASGLAGSHSNLSRVFFEQGNYDACEEQLKLALGVRETLVQKYPNTPVYLMDLSDNYNNSGYLALERGKNAVAVEMNKKALEMRNRLCAIDPSSGDYLKRRNLSLQRLASAHRYNREIDDARATFVEAISQQRQAIDRYPGSRSLEGDLAKSLGMFGDLLLNVLLDFTESEECFSEALSIFESLYADEPTFLNYANSITSMRQELGLAKARGGRPDQAVEVIRQAQREFDELVDKAPSVLMYRIGAARVHAILAEVNLQLGQWEDALNDLDQADKANAVVLTMAPDNSQGTTMVDEIKLLRALGLTVKSLHFAAHQDDALRDGQQAIAAARAARELLPSDNWAWLSSLAAAHAELGEFEKAADAQERAAASAPAEKQAEMKQRLELYRQNKPLRLPPEQINAVAHLISVESDSH